MKTIYHIDASGRYEDSNSRQLSKKLVDHLQAKHEANVKTRDLSQGLHFVNETFISGLYISDTERTAEQKESLKFSDKLVKELQDSNILVIGTPIYNFGAPASLKAWADLVARAGVTFKYGENGPIGLLENKKAYLVIVSGGVPIDSPMDFLTPWLRHFLGFIGIKDVEVITAGSLNRNREESLLKANEQIKNIL